MGGSDKQRPHSRWFGTSREETSTEHPHAIDAVPIVSCNDCGLVQRTVFQMASSIPGNRVATICFWFPSTRDCAACVAREAYRTLTLDDLVDADLSRESVTVDKVSGVMHALELETCDKMLKALVEGGASAQSASVELFVRMRKQVGKRYKGARARSNPKALKEKMRALLSALDCIPDRLPCNSKIDVVCLNGTASFSLTTMGLSLAD
jgi:hypothetical protein